MLRLVCKAQEQPRERVREMAEELCISPRTAELLLSRGITDCDEAANFLNPSESALENAYLLKDMDKAVSRIRKAIDLGEKIVVFGDYDAAIHFGHRIKRSALLSDIDRLAAYFKSAGLRRGDVYTVFLPTCVQSFVAFYALNKIGVIANIVHPLTPPELLKETMDAVGSKGVMLMDLLAKPYVDMLNFHNVPCVVCSNSDYVSPAAHPAFRGYELFAAHASSGIKNALSYRAAIHRCPPSDGVHNNGSDIAVYLHGGGTTGKSKTIKLSSKALNELAYKTGKVEHHNTPGVECSMIVLPLFHAFGLGVSMHFSMCEGFCCIPVARFKPRKANELMREYKISFIVGVPNMYKKMFEQKNFEGKHLRNLELLFSGGDIVTEQFLDMFNSTIAKWGGKGRLFRGYGLTEVSSVCCANTYADFKRNSVGKPFYGMRVEIWDKDKKRLPANTVGEIAVSGSTLMEGYLNEPTSGVYTDDSGVRWVLTGDLGYIDEDGFLFFTGRKKRLIIISGYNVYPGQIENILDAHEYVQMSCVIGVPDPYKMQKVKAFVKLAAGVPATEDTRQALLAYCRKNVAKYAMPYDIEFKEDMPKTLVGKVAYRELEEEELARIKAQEE